MRNSARNSKFSATTSAGRLHNRTEKAQTLMRSALKKPITKAGRLHQKSGYNPQREANSRQIPKHSSVKRFGTPKSISIPATSPDYPDKNRIISTSKNNSVSGYSPNDRPVVMPSMVASASHQKLERMLDEALIKADAHKQALRYHAARHFWQRPGFLGRRTGLKMALISLVVLAVTVAIAWQKFPQLSVKFAGRLANINASIPNYKPEGYSLAAPASVQDGKVLIKFKSVSGQSYDITQKPSAMTSTSLSQSLPVSGSKLQSSQIGGNTVFIYGSGNDAAWVNNGTLYTIKDRAKLNSEQLINIVKGLN